MLGIDRGYNFGRMTRWTLLMEKFNDECEISYIAMRGERTISAIASTVEISRASSVYQGPCAAILSEGSAAREGE